MLVNNEEWSTRLARVWKGLADPYSTTGRWNYRAIEAKIHRRWQSHRWFEEWVRVRPNTRRESRGYALTWQWTCRAHGHIDTSPAWNGQRPNGRTTASSLPPSTTSSGANSASPIPNEPEGHS